VTHKIPAEVRNVFAPVALVSELEVPQCVVRGGIIEAPRNLLEIALKIGDVVVGIGDEDLGFAWRTLNGIRDVVWS
jgi:hypothetical protein